MPLLTPSAMPLSTPSAPPGRPGRTVRTVRVKVRLELMPLCPGCHQMRTQRTLDKYGGVCGRCVRETDVLGRDDSFDAAHQAATITRTQRKKIWKQYKADIATNGGRCLLCTTTRITAKTMVVGYDRAVVTGGGVSIKNTMPICWNCDRDQKGLSFVEFKAMLRVVVPPRCRLCNAHAFKYTFNCCRYRACGPCVDDSQYCDGMATLWCPQCKAETNRTTALIS